MSKEREMIEKLCSFQMTYSDWLLLIADAEELLAQPEQESVYQKLSRIEDGIEVEILPSELWQDGYETGKRTMQTKQEPVAWYWEDSDLDDPEWIAMADTGDKPIEHRLRRNIQPLYLAPPKREPLSDEKLAIMYSKHAFAMDKQEYMWGFRDAEKAHGIRGEI